VEPTRGLSLPTPYRGETARCGRVAVTGPVPCASIEEVAVPERHFTEPMTVGAATEGIERILVVTAHPDDVDFGVAGSVAVWTDAGVEVAYCIATDGSGG